MAEGGSGGARLETRRGTDRFVTRTPWLESRHSFSFGSHYDPANTAFGALVASNDDVVAPGGGYDTHLHRDMEIVTWVLAGALAHEDSAGNAGVLLPGEVQRTSAGTGIRHAERNASDAEPVRFVQMWVLPEAPGGEPSYAQAVVPVGEQLTPVVSGLRAHARSAAVPLGARAALLVARPARGAVLVLPAAPRVHLYVARGAVEAAGVDRLTEGDALRVAAPASESSDVLRLAAPASDGSDGPGEHRVPLSVVEDAELLVWELHA